MRRVFAWLIPLALIAIGLLWPLVFSGGGQSAPPMPKTRWCSANYKADYVVNKDGRLDAVETITAEFPGGRHGIFKYWDCHQPEQPTGAAGAGSHLDPSRRQVDLVPDALGERRAIQGGQDRRSRQVPRPRHPCVRDPLHHRRRPRSGNHRRRTSRFAAVDRRAPTTSRSVFFWNVIAQAWNNRIQRADIYDHAARPTSRAPSARSATASARPAAT